MSTAHEENTAATASRSPVVRVLRDSFRSTVARGYLVLCLALLVWAVVDMSRETVDASFAGVWPVFVTAPVSLVMLVLPEHASMFVLSVLLGALVNTVLIGWCARVLGRGRGAA